MTAISIATILLTHPAMNTQATSSVITPTFFRHTLKNPFMIHNPYLRWARRFSSELIGEALKAANTPRAGLFERLGLHRTTRLSWASHATAHHISNNLFPDARLTWHYRIWGFGCAEYLESRANGSRLIFWQIPYWSIVIPLTVLSAFLLLKKPKTSNLKQINEPAANVGGSE
jgi:hypothetical protein